MKDLVRFFYFSNIEFLKAPCNSFEKTLKLLRNHIGYGIMYYSLFNNQKG